MTRSLRKRMLTIGAVLMLWMVADPLLHALATDVTAPAGPPPSPGGAAAPSAPAPMTDIHDIRPPVAVGFDAPWLVPAALALAAAAILAAIWWWWRKHRRKRIVETIVPELPPDMTAMRALDEIADVRRLDGKAFYFRLSTILRQYVSGRFSVGAPEMTTEEFLPCIDRLPIDRELAGRLKTVSRSMDPIKFGGAMTTDKQMETDLFFARAFIRRTTPGIEAERPAEAVMPSLSLPQGSA